MGGNKCVQQEELVITASVVEMQPKTGELSGVPINDLLLKEEEKIIIPQINGELVAKMASFMPGRSFSSRGNSLVSREEAAENTRLQELRERRLKEEQERIEREKQEKEEAEKKQKEFMMKAEAIDAFYEQYDLPLAGYGDEFVKVSEKYGLDYRQLPAHAFLESTGGKKCRNFNPFGWGNETFSSWEEAIEKVGWSISGNNPNLTCYKGKNFEQVVLVYNRENPDYLGDMYDTMKDIDAIHKDIVQKEMTVMVNSDQIQNKVATSN